MSSMLSPPDDLGGSGASQQQDPVRAWLQQRISDAAPAAPGGNEDGDPESPPEPGVEMSQFDTPEEFNANVQRMRDAEAASGVLSRDAILPLSLKPVYPMIRQRLQTMFNLDQVAMAHVDELAEASSLQEMNLINGAALFKIEQSIRETESLAARRKEWVFTEALKEQASMVARVALLSDSIEAYRGSNFEDIIFLPMDEDQPNVKIVKKHIGTALTLFRSTIKTKLSACLDRNNKASENIADVCAAICSPVNVQPTLAMLIRFAFIRWHARQYKDHEYVSGAGFWPKVDHTLRTWAVTFKTKLELDRAFTELYNEDKQKFDGPEKSSVHVQAPHQIPEWVAQIHNAVKAVHNTVSLDDDPAAYQGRKRKRADEPSD
ncbi:hypothetical protein BD626DRAFT_537861 [Schizophyllum amplum]|uniref:Uncharacterized protein n=1 Tax=Schizophyllum amplum TaxID=97359 RepID=A0A550CA51_9AGAR|nr:hypothetical protein BD626DRAFT_537861 [Auriculariopsis ampla]